MYTVQLSRRLITFSIKNSLKMPTNILKKYISKIFLQVYITELRLHKNYSKADFLPQKGVECVIAFSDTDNFKTINDKFGHSYGDRVLRIIGTTLSKLCPPKGIVCRFGGDEFVVFSLLQTVFQWKNLKIMCFRRLQMITFR